MKDDTVKMNVINSPAQNTKRCLKRLDRSHWSPGYFLAGWMRFTATRQKEFRSDKGYLGESLLVVSYHCFKQCLLTRNVSILFPWLENTRLYFSSSSVMIWR